MSPDGGAKKFLLGIVLAVVVAAGASAAVANSEDPPSTDYTAIEARVSALEAISNTDLLKLACHVASVSAANEGLETRNCRRVSIEETPDGFAKVAISVLVRGTPGRFTVTTYLHHTNWQVERMSIEHG